MRSVSYEITGVFCPKVSGKDNIRLSCFLGDLGVGVIFHSYLHRRKCYTVICPGVNVCNRLRRGSGLSRFLFILPRMLLYKVQHRAERLLGGSEQNAVLTAALAKIFDGRPFLTEEYDASPR